jgi:surface protein
MKGMFNGCNKLTEIDVSNFETSSVYIMELMFRGCSALKTIYASQKWSTESVVDSTNMFYGASKLVGGNGTAYSSSATDATYARIDTAETPGYFTYRQARSDELLVTVGTMRDIADAIREKTGSTDSLTPGQMVEAVNGFSGGPIVGTVTTTSTAKNVVIQVDKLYSHAILFPLQLFIDSAERAANSEFNIISMTRELTWGTSTSNPVHYIGATLTEGGYNDDTFEDDENALCVNGATAYVSAGEFVTFTDTTVRFRAQTPFAPGKYAYVLW